MFNSTLYLGVLVALVIIFGFVLTNSYYLATIGLGGGITERGGVSGGVDKTGCPTPHIVCGMGEYDWDQDEACENAMDALHEAGHEWCGMGGEECVVLRWNDWPADDCIGDDPEENPDCVFTSSSNGYSFSCCAEVECTRAEA